MNARFKDAGMIAGMVIAWSIFYAVSKRMVDATGSAYAAGLLLQMVRKNWKWKHPPNDSLPG